MYQSSLIGPKTASILGGCTLLLCGLLWPAGAYSGGGEKTIVGRWNLVSNKGVAVDKKMAGTLYVRFNRDGTWTSTVPFFYTMDGKYKFLSGKVIELDVPGILYGRNKFEVTFTLSKDQLIIDDPTLRDLEFKRVDSGK
jgi:hypothetical protein